MKIKAEIDGKELEFEMLNKGRTEGVTHYLISDGIFPQTGTNWREVPLRLIRPRHTFGPLVFEETGESRFVGADEWALDGCHAIFVLFSDESPSKEMPILRPVSIEDSE